jgi:hypothetical protein
MLDRREEWRTAQTSGLRVEDWEALLESVAWDCPNKEKTAR